MFFFLYVSLNLPYPESSTGQAVARLYASNLAKHIKKITSSFGVDYFLPLPLFKENLVKYKGKKNKSRCGVYCFFIPKFSIVLVYIFCRSFIFNEKFVPNIHFFVHFYKFFFIYFVTINLIINKVKLSFRYNVC